MCFFFDDCKRSCKSYKSHFVHWKHVQIYCKHKDKKFLHYDTYKRLHEVDNNDNCTKRNKRSSLINYTNYERNLISHMVSDIVNDILDKIE
jgi:hypothetical protein